MDELSTAQIAELATDLQILERELEGQLGRIATDSKPVALDQQMVGRLSRMDAMQQQQMARAGQVHMQAHLVRVRRALQAVAAGDYGLCKSCEEPIVFARLKARPDTRLCIGCQQRDEN